jgi:hypothetical protein
MNVFFNFVKNLNKGYMFKVGLSKFIGIQCKGNNLLYSLYVD